MRYRTAMLLVVMATSARAQESDRMLAVLRQHDTASLAVEVRRRPAAARDRLGELLSEAGRAKEPRADSLLRLSHALASAYAAVWSDSFPLTTVERFARMTAGQRGAKVVADSLRLAGNDALGAHGVRAAMAIWRDALRRSRAIDDSAAIAAAIGNIGAGYYLASKLDSAQPYLSRARDLAQMIGDRRTAMNAISTLGSVAKDRGNLSAAQQSYTSALVISQRIGDVAGMSADHNNLGLIASALGDVDDARTHYSEALRIARDAELDDAAVTSLINLGNLASADADYDDAAKRYTEALSLARKHDDDADAGLSLHNLGLLALRTGDYRAARDRLMQALALFTHAGTDEDLVRIHVDLASVDEAMGELLSARAQLKRAEQVSARVPRSYALAGAVALGEADLALELNEYTEAERSYSRAQTLFHRAGDPLEIAAREGGAAVLARRGEYAAAASRLETIVRAQLVMRDGRSAALTRLALARARQQSGDTTSARRLIKQAIDSLHSRADAVAEGAALLALGDLDGSTGAPLAAEADYRKGLARIGARSAPAVSWQLHAGLAEALRSRDATSEAVSQLRLAIADVERMASSLTVSERRSVFRTDKWDPYVQLALIERERGDVASAFAVSERMRARQMLEIFARGAVTRSPATDTAMVARERILRNRIAELAQRLESNGTVSSLRGPGPVNPATDANREALARAQEEYEQVLLDLDEESDPKSGLRADVTPWSDVASHLERGQALLEYLVTDSTTLVFIVKHDTVQAIDLGIGQESLASLVDFARGTIARRSTAGGSNAWRAPLRRLYALLIGPVEDTGLLDDVRTLVIVPHAELHYLPFAALMRERDRHQFLVERFDIAYAPSASMWVRLSQRRSPANNRVLALAPRASVLPGSRSEVEAIKSIYGSEAAVFSGGEATEHVFRSAGDRYGLIHLATNGILNPRNPLFSFVELSPDTGDDGRLEVHEVFGLALHTRLLVLSACQTGLASGASSDVPAGDDWVGLVRAFLGAGAERVIATLWTVEDRSTAQMMERLHRHLHAGDEEIAALSQAQRETLRNSATAGPFYWAGFVIEGGSGRQ